MSDDWRPAPAIFSGGQDGCASNGVCRSVGRYNAAVRRFPRILLNLATAVSLVLCVATVVLAVRSFSRAYGIVWWRVDGNGSLYLVSGDLRWHTSAGPDSQHYRGDETYFAAVEPYPMWTPYRGSPTFRFAGVRYYRWPNGPVTDREVILPLWLAIAAWSLVPLVRIYRSFPGRRRAGGGRCPACGYDLRATPDRCPECGALPTTATPTTP